ARSGTSQVRATVLDQYGNVVPGPSATLMTFSVDPPGGGSVGLGMPGPNETVVTTFLAPGSVEDVTVRAVYDSLPSATVMIAVRDPAALSVARLPPEVPTGAPSFLLSTVRASDGTVIGGVPVQVDITAAPGGGGARISDVLDAAGGITVTVPSESPGEGVAVLDTGMLTGTIATAVRLPGYPLVATATQATVANRSWPKWGRTPANNAFSPDEILTVPLRRKWYTSFGPLIATTSATFTMPAEVGGTVFLTSEDDVGRQNHFLHMVRHDTGAPFPAVDEVPFDAFGGGEGNSPLVTADETNLTHVFAVRDIFTPLEIRRYVFGAPTSLVQVAQGALHSRVSLPNIYLRNLYSIEQGLVIRDFVSMADRAYINDPAAIVEFAPPVTLHAGRALRLRVAGVPSPMPLGDMRLQAFDARDGVLLWDTAPLPGSTVLLTSSAFTTLTAARVGARDLVYFGVRHDKTELFAYDISTGTLAWRRDVSQPGDLQLSDVRAAPVVAGSVVYLQVARSPAAAAPLLVVLVAYDALTGSPVAGFTPPQRPIATGYLYQGAFGNGLFYLPYPLTGDAGCCPASPGVFALDVYDVTGNLRQTLTETGYGAGVPAGVIVADTSVVTQLGGGEVICWTAGVNCPVGLTARVSPAGVQLSWSAPVAGTYPLSGYRVLRVTAPGAPPVQIAVVAVPGVGFVDAPVPAGRTFDYQVLAVDTAGNESEACAHVVVRIPALVVDPRDWPQFHRNERRLGVSPLSLCGTLDLKWSRTLGPRTSSNGTFGSPSSALGKVFVGTMDGRLDALDLMTGAPVWSRTLSAVSVEHAPAVVAYDGNGIVVVGTPTGLSAFDGNSGSPLWSLTLAGGLNRASPAALAGTIFAVSTGGDVVAVDAFTGARLWLRNLNAKGSVFESAPAVAGGSAYVLRGESPKDVSLFNLDAATGVVVGLPLNIKNAGDFVSAPVVAGVGLQ
ncbi:MAG: PQQ-binding-like beta-propeller repeat protein, partial [bacterium]